MSIRSECTEGSDTGGKESRQATIKDTKEEWKQLWRNRLDDKMRAEGIANENYQLLFVDRGTVVIATRDYAPLNLREILHQHGFYEGERYLPPPPSVGGWGKFVRTVIQKQRRQSRSQEWKASQPRRRIGNREKLQLKKGGRGWLHLCTDR